MTASTATRRERQRQATLDEIVTVSRGMLNEPGGLTLRSVAQQMGITAPALYRYVESYQDLVHLIAQDIDEETAALLRRARDAYPADDPAAQIIATAIAFRGWALTHRQEFGLVFANPITSHENLTPNEVKDQQTGTVFTDLLTALWEKYRFPVPSLDELDPHVVEALNDPMVPGHSADIPQEQRGLLWVFMRSWVALYGTVTLEVFGHCDPRVIASAALFRSMMVDQSQLLGIGGELPRLLPMIEAELARS